MKMDDRMPDGASAHEVRDRLEKYVSERQVDDGRRVALTYELTVEGEIVDRAEPAQPLEFVMGQNMLLPRFEEQVRGLYPTDTFSFDLSPEEAYGPYYEEMKKDIPLEVFRRDGKLDPEVVFVGNVLPMMTDEGHRFDGRILQIDAETLLMDFNHALAGKSLHFEGRIERVTTLSPEELAQLQHECCGGGGCCCGEHGGGDSSCCGGEHHEGHCCGGDGGCCS